MFRRFAGVTPRGPVDRRRSRGHRITAAAGIALAVSTLAASRAQAETCTVPTFPFGNVATVASTATSVAANIAANIATANTAFLTQSSAFVNAPGNPQPDQQGGGVWTRGVVGQVDIKSASTNALVLQVPTGTPFATASEPCTTTVRSSFEGIQLGADIARLNVNGWNFHVGTTAGSLYLNNNIIGGAPLAVSPNGPATVQVPFDSSAQVPFIGAYLVATHGGFFSDLLIRADAYQMNLNSPGLDFFNQNMNARGLSVSGSVGYNYQIPNANGWFIEPSAGLLYSRVKVDPLNIAGSPSLFASVVPGTETFNDIVDTIGRVGLRVGTSFGFGALTVQPFAAASVWHDFAGNATAHFTTCPGCAAITGPFPPIPAALTDAFSGTNIGTYGQYSVGAAASIANTGWIGFVRADYRSGPNLNGWDGTGGIRYQFTPGEVATKSMAVKASPQVHQEVSWDGLYIGAVAGAEQGTAHFGYGSGSVDPRIAGVLGGFDLGYNWRNGAWIYGLEGEWDWTDAKGGIGCGPLAVGGPLATSSPLFLTNCNAEQSWIASVTPRLGYAWGRDLFYVKGGVAVTRESAIATCDYGPRNGVLTFFGFPGQACAPTAPTSFLSTSSGFSGSAIRAGWTVGYGVQFALTGNWSAKAETDYVDFGSRTLVASGGTPLNVGMHGWQAKIGVNYRLDGGRLADSAVPAVTAGMPVKAPPPAAPASAVTWAGCYVGATLGGAFEHVTYAGTPSASLNLPADAANLAAVTTGSMNKTTPIAGGEGGCNWQAREFVLGIETDLSGFGRTQSANTASTATPFFTAFTANSTASSNWLYTLRPRLGVANGHWLIFATGGLALGNFNFSQSVFYNDTALLAFFGIPPTSQAGSFNSTVAGEVVGGGIEYALSNNWSVKSEYLYVNFASRHMTETGVILPFTETSKDKLCMSIARAGVDYRW
jgi:opacity protein-like surface antigen